MTFFLTKYILLIILETCENTWVTLFNWKYFKLLELPGFKIRDYIYFFWKQLHERTKTFPGDIDLLLIATHKKGFEINFKSAYSF